MAAGLQKNMQDNRVIIDPKRALIIWRTYFATALAIGVVALSLLAREPSQSGAVIAGYSLARLLAIILISLGTIAAAILLARSWLKTDWVNGVIQGVLERVSQSNWWCLSVILAGSISLKCIFLITLIPDLTEIFTRVFLGRLQPVIFWLAGLSTITLILLIAIRFKKDWLAALKHGKLFYATLAGIGLIFIGWGWVARNTLETEANTTGLNRLGSPIIETQVIIAWVSGMALLTAIALLQRRSAQRAKLGGMKPIYLDMAIGILLWLASVLLWQGMPILPNWFVSIPRQPNYDYYPASDALFYDLTAQFQLVGEGFQDGNAPYVRRPLHSLFLSVLHLTAGQHYENVVALQIVVLALIPVLLYLLTSQLHNRIAGLMAAVLILLRETNSIAISGSATTSHAKLLMSDLPTTLGVILFILLTTIWLKNSQEINIYPMLTGGALAIPVLIRIETILFFFILALIAAIVINIRKHPLVWFGSMLLFTLGLGLVLAPWVWRNWKTTGRVFIDTPTFRFEVLSVRYRPAENETGININGDRQRENQAQAEPEATEEPVKYDTSTPEGYMAAVTARTKNFIQQNPAQVAGFILTHYLNSQIQPIMYLPISMRAFESLTAYLGHRSPARLWEECCTTSNYVQRLPYWRKWDGIFPNQALVPLLVNVLLLATGISVTWKRNRLVGLVPLIFSSLYILGNAMFRNSGGRYILPVDWVSVLYFSSGLAALSVTCASHILKIDLSAFIDQPTQLTKPSAEKKRAALLRKPGFYLAAVGLLLFGSTLPLVESAIPPRFTPTRDTNMQATFMESSLLDEEQKSLLKEFLAQGGTVVTGRALFPRYYPKYVDEPGNEGIIGPKPYRRLSFVLVGPEFKFAFLPLKSAPAYFPNGVDVIVYACPDERAETLMVGIFNPDGTPGEVIIRSPLPEVLTCPLEEPGSTGN